MVFYPCEPSGFRFTEAQNFGRCRQTAVPNCASPRRGSACWDRLRKVSLDGRWKRYLGEPPRNLMSSSVSSSSAPCSNFSGSFQPHIFASSSTARSLSRIWPDRCPTGSRIRYMIEDQAATQDFINKYLDAFVEEL